MTDTTEVTGADLFEVRKLKGMSQTEVAKKVSYSTAYVCHLEKAFRPVHAGIVRLYEERLGVELGAIVKRRNLMISITTLGFVESLPRLAAGLGPVPMVAPEGTVRVGAAEVESMWDVQEFLVKSDHRNGGVAVVDYVVPALNRATRLMHGTMTDAIRRELCTAVSALANRCSWIYYDAGDWKKSSDCVRYAITANEFQNPSIRIRSIEGAAWCLDSHPVQAAKALEEAADINDAHPVFKAGAHAIRAEFLALSGQHREAVNEIKISDRYVEKRGEVLRYSPYLKPSVVQHLQIDAWAAMGELDRAEKLYSEALPVSGRRRPLTPLRMAKAYALRGHHDRAKELLDQAQSTATRFRSVRIERELNSVHMTLGKPVDRR